MTTINKEKYREFLESIKEQVYQSQYEALKQVNKELIKLYWSIGKSIYERQEVHRWGKSIIENLSKDLQIEFPGIKGFSTRNLWYMLKLYENYERSEKLQPLVAEIGWSHNLIILEKCKDDLEREFYLKATSKFGWSKSALIHQIEGQAYERFLLKQTNFDKTIGAKQSKRAKLSIKDSYSFDFLEMGTEYAESDLESGLIKNIRKFLIEMGGDYAFISNQYQLEVGGKLFYIDLLLYHRKLKCLIAIELKTTDFRPEFAGKMQFYLAVLDDKVKLPEENASIGIVICKSKNRTVVEYALKTAVKPMGIADYTLTNKVPKELKGLLPDPQDIVDGLEGFFDS